MTRAKAEKVLEDAGYGPHPIVHHDSPGYVLQGVEGATPPASNNFDWKGLVERLDEAERNVALLTALIRAVAPARFGLGISIEQMCKEAGILP